MIRRNIHLETRLIDDLLDLTRIAHQKLALDLRVVDVRDVLRSVIDFCRADVDARDQRLDVDFATARHHVLGDAARLSQIFWNLLRNAVKFTPDGGAITVRTRNPSDGSVAVEVADTGVGIAPEVLPRLFNPFEQGEVEVTRHFGGLGLGLAISKALMDAHGGELRAASDGRDRGSRFTVVLPLATPEAEQAAKSPPPGSEAARPSLRILLVEDHTDTARVLSRLLAREGHAVRWADTVEGALRLAGAEQFDLLISDVGLLDSSGTDLVRRLRDVRGPLPGIALTGYGTPDDITATREAGFATHLTKPIDLQKLRTEIWRLADPGAASSPSAV